MPDPLLYFQATVASAIISAIVVLVIAMLGRGWEYTTQIASALAFVFGVGVGCWLLNWQIVFPPATGLDRLFIVVLPVVLAVELIASAGVVPTTVRQTMRILLAVMIPRVLLHGSVYISGADDGWTLSRLLLTLGISSVLLVVVWATLSPLASRAVGASTSLAIGLALIGCGMTVMMAGYIKGGVAAMPIAATLFGTTIAMLPRARCGGGSATAGMRMAVEMGVVALFSLLFVGHFFGRLSAISAVTILLAPLLCWVTEVPILRQENPWRIGVLRLAVVSIPLVAVLYFAKGDFDRKMAPLLVDNATASNQRFGYCVRQLLVRSSPQPHLLQQR